MTAKAPAAPAFIEAPPPSYAADDTRTQPVGRTKSERKALAVLERRAEWLHDTMPPQGHTARDHMRAERAALLWALGRIAELERLEQASAQDTTR